MKSINISDHKITNQITLKQLPTSINLDADRDQTKKALKKVRRKLGELQEKTV